MLFIKERRKFIIYLLNGWPALWATSLLPLKQAFAKRRLDKQEDSMQLPPAKSEETVSVEQAIRQRRTVRGFLSTSLDAQQVSILLWAAQGITGKRGFKRAAPSAGALYPMDVYVVAGTEGIETIEAGVHHYDSQTHALSLVAKGGLRAKLAHASLSQMWMARAPINILITAEYKRATGKYGKRGFRYAMIEAGHIGQNLFLQAEALGLKAGIVGAFHDKEVIKVLKIPSAHEPLLIMPIGYHA